MNKHILFIQGGGDGGYEADKILVSSLEAALGKEYEVSYPEIKSDESAPDFGWIQQIGRPISATRSNIILAGHSFGASMILKYLSENPMNKNIQAIFLIATPLWNGDEAWQAGLKLHENFVENLPAGVPIYFYHCKDDEEISFLDFEQYKQKLPHAIFREIEKGGHQFNNDLTLVAKDIKALPNRT